MQLVFLHLVSVRSGHPLDLTKPSHFLYAMIKSFRGSTGVLEGELRWLL